MGSSVILLNDECGRVTVFPGYNSSFLLITSYRPDVVIYNKGNNSIGAYLPLGLNLSSRGCQRSQAGENRIPSEFHLNVWELRMLLWYIGTECIRPLPTIIDIANFLKNCFNFIQDKNFSKSNCREMLQLAVAISIFSSQRIFWEWLEDTKVFV